MADFIVFRIASIICSDTQLLCCGAVQWYANTTAARGLLKAWQHVIAHSPGSADDKCLDLAFNNLTAVAQPLRTAWLHKSYARYAWWIYERPVIDHPEFPASGAGFIPLEQLEGRPRIHLDRVSTPRVHPVFPRELLIDTEMRTLLRLFEARWHVVGSVSTPLWPPGNDGYEPWR